MRRILAALQHGELSDTARRRVETHLAQCAVCRDTMKRREKADRLLHAARPAPASLPADAAQAIFARALLQADVQADGRPRPGRLRSLAWCLGLTCLAVLALLAMRPHPPAKIKSVIAENSPRHFDTTPKLPRLPDMNTDAESGLADAYMAMRSAFSEPRADAPTPKHRPRPPRHHRWRSNYLAAHLRQRHRHPTPYSSPAIRQVEPQVAQAVPEPQEPEGRLVVKVTHEPGLAVEVTHAAEDAPGYAEATCFRRGFYGEGIWQRCMIHKSEAGADTVQTQIAMAAPQPEQDLLAIQAATGAADNKEQPK
jgi:hypothetical protein